MRKGDLETKDKWKIANVLAQRSGWICGYCGCNLVPFGEDDKYCYLTNGKWVLVDGFFWSYLDHKIPVARGGNNDIENMVLSCRSCNRRKGKKTAEEFSKGQI